MLPGNLELLPTEIHELAAWFSKGVRAELESMEKNGGAQSYEVISGELIEIRNETEGVFRFIIADGLRIPEETRGG